MRLYSIVSACLLLSATTQAAPLLNVQFGADPAGGGGPAYTGAAVVGAGGDYWNYLYQPGVDTALSDILGGTTAMTLNFDGSAITSPFGSGFDGTPYVNLMQSYLYNSLGADTITISGLSANATFDLYIYSQGDVAADGRTMEVNVNGVIADTNATVASASTFISGQNYLDLAVTSDSSGMLNIFYTQLVGEAVINGLQIVESSGEAPEPTTFWLLAAGLATFACRNRRNKKR